MRLSLFLLAAVIAAPVLAQNAGDAAKKAATEPLRATRIKDEKIPPILQHAASAPYSLSGISGCAGIKAEVQRLNAALGADVDTPGKEPGEGSAIASAAASSAVSSIVPGLGLLKVVTGADKQQRRVQGAVHAGSVRRGFLKGVGLARGCAFPAAPTAAARKAVPQALPADH